MSISFHNLFVIFLLISIIIKSSIIFPILHKLYWNFPGEAISLFQIINKLEILGFKRFILNEIILFLFPILISISIIFYLPNYMINEINLINLMLFTIGILFWLFFDVKRTFRTNLLLNDINNDIKKWTKGSGSSIVEILNQILIIRLGIKSISRKITKNKKKVIENIVPTWAKSTVNLFNVATETLLNVKNAAINSISDLGLQSIDAIIRQYFKKYSEKNLSEIIFSILISIFPIIWYSLFIVIN